jgi:ribosomal protein S18 acetylase RimI-like enzyme
MTIRRAHQGDIFQIAKLYFTVYGDQYPDDFVYNYAKMEEMLMRESMIWMIGEDDQKIVGSVIFNYDANNLISKVYAACVLPEYRGHNLTSQLMDEGLQILRENTPGVDVAYATVRTLNASVQKLTERLGYRKLGIFPNVHKTSKYETHGLVTLFSQDCFSKRFTDFKLHPDIHEIYDIVSKEIPELQKIEVNDYFRPSVNLNSFIPNLEVIEAPEFVKYRFKKLQSESSLELEFFPFHEPNILVTSPDQSVEIFVTLNEDGYCAILGGRTSSGINYRGLILKISDMLRDYGARYLEMIIRPDQIAILDNVLKAKFIPSAYVPAFQLIEGKRYDFVVLSRSFEIFDFQNVDLQGRNQEYLAQYYNHWKRSSLNPKLLLED